MAVRGWRLNTMAGVLRLVLGALMLVKYLFCGQLTASS
jgi:hypothetical protein